MLSKKMLGLSRLLSSETSGNCLLSKRRHSSTNTRPCGVQKKVVFGLALHESLLQLFADLAQNVSFWLEGKGYDLII